MPCAQRTKQTALQRELLKATQQRDKEGEQRPEPEPQPEPEPTLAAETWRYQTLGEILVREGIAKDSAKLRELAQGEEVRGSVCPPCMLLS